MPGGNGTGPRGQGPGTGRKMGGKGFGYGGRGNLGRGPGGNCVCPSCGTKVSHRPGTPCYDMKCPKCNVKMVRE